MGARRAGRRRGRSKASRKLGFNLRGGPIVAADAGSSRMCPGALHLPSLSLQVGCTLPVRAASIPRLYFLHYFPPSLARSLPVGLPLVNILLRRVPYLKPTQ